MGKVIWVDFDGTLTAVDCWPAIGAPNMAMIQHCIQTRASGGKVILFTCREGAMLETAVAWCRALGLEFDAINAQLPEQVERFGNDSRKISADEIYDDRAREIPREELDE